MSSAFFFKNLHCHIKRHRIFIKTLAYKSIKNVCCSHNAGAQRNFITFKSYRITASVPFFMMIECHVLCNCIQLPVFNRRKKIKKLVSFGRVYFHKFAFLLRKTPRLIKNTFRNVDFSYVVKKSCRFIQLDYFISKNIYITAVLPQLTCNNSNVFLRMNYMPPRKKIVAS